MQNTRFGRYLRLKSMIGNLLFYGEMCETCVPEHNTIHTFCTKCGVSMVKRNSDVYKQVKKGKKFVIEVLSRGEGTEEEARQDVLDVANKLGATPMLD